jgi:hypothetical protein
MAPDGTYVCDTPAPISQPRELDGVGNPSQGFAAGMNAGAALGNLWANRRLEKQRRDLEEMTAKINENTKKLERVYACVQAANAAGKGKELQDYCLREFQ